MPHPTPTVPRASKWFDASVLLVGLLLLAFAVHGATSDASQIRLPDLLTVPLIVVIARFPMLLERGSGGIEVGFDSCVLMFLMFTLPPHDALILWTIGITLTQLIADKPAASKRFNIGLGIIGGAVSAEIISVVRGDEFGAASELLAVALAAAAYFTVDFMLSAISVAAESGTPLRQEVVQPGTVLALASLVAFDSLGYLAAVMVRTTPWWTLTLLAVPLATLLVATRAVTRGGENARRLTVLFDASVRAQTLTHPQQVVEALVEDARRLLRLRQVEVRPTPPGANEVGAKLRDVHHDRWIVAPGRDRARSTSSADQTALEAMAAVYSDAFARLRLTQDMTHLARHDALTGLPNRALLLDRVEHAIHLNRRRGGQIALLFCDLDGFKPVNDRFGHAAGDAVLEDVARRLTACVREGDTVARLGGDEFAILLEDVHPPEVDKICRRVLSTLRTGAFVVGHEVPLGVSIGIAFGDTGSSAEHLLRNADMAMYEAKSRGKDQHVRYEPSLGLAQVERLELLEKLRDAVDAGDLGLAYQPVVEVASGRIMGVEALVRWNSNGVNMPPDVFIKAAEESGLVVALGDVVLDLAVADAELFSVAADGGPFSIAINISPKQLRDPSFVDRVEGALESLDSIDLILEITERDYVDDPGSREVIARLAELGVAFAIDDFGVGFSSISYLQDMPIRIIKTDINFSDAIDRDERACALLRSIALMGEALELDVVVEGIERETQLEHLREHVLAPYTQGYLMYRPMPAEDAARAVARNRTVLDPDPDPELDSGLDNELSGGTEEVTVAGH